MPPPQWRSSSNHNSRSSTTKRARPWIVNLVVTAFVIVSCLATLAITNAQYFEEDLQSCSPDQVNYEWERLNHYEILGFLSTTKKSLSKLDNKDIRKAYRKQAQVWHPDKIKANETMPIEEINARFSHISQAYQTLNDTPKRQAYDQFLENCQHNKRSGRRGGGEGGAYSSNQSNGGGRNPNSSRKKQPPSYAQSNNNYNNPRHQDRQHSSRSSYGQERDQQGFQQRSNPPSSERKEREMLVDPMTGAPILRETTYQEYRDDNYYRVYIEDYLVESMDAWGNTYYQPLYPYPQVIKEGQLYDAPADTLAPGDFLRMEQTLMSSNGRYQTRLHGCQLVIEIRDASSLNEAFDPKIETVWRSNNDVLYSSPECFLGFEEGQLLIAGGSPEFHTGAIFWHSIVNNDDDSDEEDIGFGFGSMHNKYMARLENDGKLIVYKVDILSSLGADDGALGKCVYATGPLGCTRVASKMSGFARDVKEFVASVFDDIMEKSESEDDGHDNDDDDDDDDDDDIPAKLLRKAKETAKTFNDAIPRVMADVRNFIESVFESDVKEYASEYTYFDNADDNGDDDDEVTEGLLGKAIVVLKAANRNRKHLEESLEHKTIKFVQDVYLRWQERR